MKHELIFRTDQYYQGILQIRPRNKEVLDFSISEIKKSKSCELSKLIETKPGYDLYLTSQRSLQALGIKLKRKFPSGILKKSKSIFGKSRMTSREVYRVTVCFRL